MLTNEELKSINAGAISWGFVGSLIGGAVAFFVGFIDGQARLR